MSSHRPSSRRIPAFAPVARAAAAVAGEKHAHLAARRRWDDEDIHRTRVLIKKLRAFLHLGRGVIPGKERRAWNERLREAARVMTSAREAKILKGWVETAVSLAPAGHDRHLPALLRKLEKDFPRRLPPGARGTVLEVLGSFAAHCGESWTRLQSHPRAGLRRSKEKMEEAARAAAKGVDPEAWHLWRRRVKYAAYQWEWIALARKSKPTARYRNLRQIGSALGKSNDMHNLRDWLARRGGKSALARYLDAWAEDAARQWETKARDHWKKASKSPKS